MSPEVLENGSGKILDLGLLHRALERIEMLVHKKWQGMSNGKRKTELLPPGSGCCLTHWRLERWKEVSKNPKQAKNPMMNGFQ